MRGKYGRRRQLRRDRQAVIDAECEAASAQQRRDRLAAALAAESEANAAVLSHLDTIVRAADMDEARLSVIADAAAITAETKRIRAALNQWERAAVRDLKECMLGRSDAIPEAVVKAHGRLIQEFGISSAPRDTDKPKRRQAVTP